MKQTLLILVDVAKDVLPWLIVLGLIYWAITIAGCTGSVDTGLEAPKAVAGTNDPFFWLVCLLVGGWFVASSFSIWWLARSNDDKRATIELLRWGLATGLREKLTAENVCELIRHADKSKCHISGQIVRVAEKLEDWEGGAEAKGHQKGVE